MHNQLFCGAGERLQAYILYWVSIAQGTAKDKNGNPPDAFTSYKARSLALYVFNKLLRDPDLEQDKIIDEVMAELGRKWPRPEFERG